MQEQDPKERHLRRHGALHLHPYRVTDSLFAESEFFDSRDLLVVKYEMLRRVLVDGVSVVDAVKRFGFSRACFYKTLAAFEQGGLVALLPDRPGPRRAHKLTEEILTWMDAQAATHGPLSSNDLVKLMLQHHDMRVHPRSVERALAKRKKGAP